MKLTITKSVISVIGRIWLPPVVCAMDYTLTDYDMGNLLSCSSLSVKSTLQNGGEVLGIREATEQWLAKNSGDFQEIIDFTASLEIDGETVEIPWMNEDNEITYLQCMFPDSDE